MNLIFSSSKGIQLQVYSLLRSNPTGEIPKPNTPKYSIRENPEIISIGEKYGKSAPQIALKYLIQGGIAVVAKSINPTSVALNMQLWDFELDDQDIRVINYVHLEKVQSQTEPANQHEFAEPVCGVHIFRMYMI